MRNDFNFNDILVEYLIQLAKIKRLKERENLSEETVFQMLLINRCWYHSMRDYACEESDYIEELTNPGAINRVAFLLPVKQRCPGSESGRPYKVLRYRQHLIPVYDDDYGQQDFALIGKEIVSGGAYNFFANTCFVDSLDYSLEKAYMDDKYDFQKEINAMKEKEEK